MNLGLRSKQSRSYYPYYTAFCGQCKGKMEEDSVKTLFVFVGTVRDLRRLLDRGVAERVSEATAVTTGGRTSRVSQIRIRHVNRQRAKIEGVEEAWGA